MIADQDKTNDLEVFKMVQAHFLQDLRLFWVRNNTYLLISGALLSVLASISNRPLAALVVSVFGLTVSLFWLAVARSSFRWLGIWRHELCKLDVEVDRLQVIKRVEEAPLRRWHSPSWITQWLPAAIGLGWVGILSGLAFQALR